MERLRDHTEKLRRQIDHDVAWSVLAKNFDGTKPRRFVSGVAISSKEKNANGDSFEARGVAFNLPILLLWEHNFLQPLGRVTGVDDRGAELLITAEVSNSGCLQWVEDVWGAVISKRATRISIQGRNLAVSAIDRTYVDWCLDEVSLAEAGADPHARIRRVWEMAPVVYLHRPSVTEYWKSP